MGRGISCGLAYSLLNLINNNNNNNGLTLVPWQSGRSLVWDVIVVCPLADSYVASAAREARSVAKLAATKKEDKYSGLAADYLFRLDA